MYNTKQIKKINQYVKLLEGREEKELVWGSVNKRQFVAYCVEMKLEF
jgi:hypothetical protein